MDIEYYMEVARATAKRSKCLDKQVGAIAIDEDGIIIATGYNGPPRNYPHCSECDKSISNMCPAVHAEQNVLIQADPRRIHTIVVTLEPCITCTKMLMNTACKQVVFEKRTNPMKSGKILWQQTKAHHFEIPGLLFTTRSKSCAETWIKMR